MYNTISIHKISGPLPTTEIMLERLLTEQTNPESRHLDEFSTVRLLEVMNAADAEVAHAVALEIPRIARCG